MDGSTFNLRHTDPTVNNEFSLYTPTLETVIMWHDGIKNT